jgi:hypothetical protein
LQQCGCRKYKVTDDGDMKARATRRENSRFWSNRQPVWLSKIR